MMPDSLLIVFAKAPRPGFVKTRLAAEIGDEQAAEIYRALAEHAWNAGLEARSALPCALWLYLDPPDSAAGMAVWLPGADAYIPQPPGDLGIRILEAFRQGFAAGFRRVAIVGTDAPGLSVDLIRRGFEGCDETRMAAGPAEDGGFYFLALSARQDALFRDIPWSAGTTLATIRDRARELDLGCTELDILRDIDTPEDWAWFRATPTGAALAATLDP